jgi:hypothetical protein
VLHLGIGTGNPGVFQGYPYSYRRKPVPVPKGTGTGTGFAKTRGYATRVRVRLQNQPKNLATAVQVSIDTAVQHCEDRKDESGAVVSGMVRELLAIRPDGRRCEDLIQRLGRKKGQVLFTRTVVFLRYRLSNSGST